MRRNRNTASKAKACFLIVVVALVLPLSANALLAGADSLGAMGERVATFAAALGMPDSALELLRERFRDELYTPEEETGRTVPALPIPQLPSQEDKPDSEESPQSPREDPSTLVAPRIPAQYRAILLSEDFSGQEGGSILRVGAGLLRNDTKYTNDDVARWLEEEWSLAFEADGQPQVLIYHTHATESFERYDNTVYDTRNTWRSTDNNNNMVAVGAAMAQVLEENGIAVIHDTTQHDYPSYNGSYEWSARTVSDYLEQYPSIQIVLDLHRDAMERENATIVKPVTTIGGQKAAQIMIIAGSDNGSMNMPRWQENMLFAAAFQDCMESAYPGLTRPILLSHRKYNQHLSAGGLLLEFGSNANTLEEAVYSGRMAGQALADLIWEHTQ